MYKIILSLFISLFVVVAHADQTSFIKLSALLNSIQSMQANFNQTIYDNKNKAIQQTTGSVSLQRPGRFRWEVIKPIPQLIVANQTTLWIYDRDLEQVTVRSIKQASDNAPALLLSHDASIFMKNYNIKNMQQQDPDWQWFELIPIHSDSFAAIRMGFYKNQINEMQLQDKLGHTTRIRFLDARFNMKLSPALFIFKPPAHVDVINESQ